MVVVFCAADADIDTDTAEDAGFDALDDDGLAAGTVGRGFPAFVAGLVGRCGSFGGTGSWGSAGVSSGLCWPVGFKGSLRVPLFGLGVIPTESHSKLYNSMFSGRRC